MRDFTSDGTTYDPQINRSWQEYDGYVSIVATPKGGIASYLNHTDGFVEDVLRGSSRSAASKANIQAILTNAAYMNTSGLDPMDHTDYSREVAYTLITLINAQRVGITLTTDQTTRIGIMLGYALGHINKWVTQTTNYFRPFMGALTAKALIHYYTYVSQDSRIAPALALMADYSWTACWKGTAGAWGDANAFLYTDRTGFDPQDGTSTPDLNMLICPYFGWLWWQQGLQKWRDRGDLIFQGGIPVYAGAVRTSGADMGTPSLPHLKRINQQMYWGPEYIRWGEMTPLVSASSGGSLAGIPYAALTTSGARGSDRGTITTVSLTINLTNTDFTIFTPAADAWAVVIGWVYQEADAHNLTIKSGSTTLTQMERAANSGAGFPCDIARPIFMSQNAGEALKIQSTTTVVPMLFYVLERRSMVSE
jgi:hypothetical protein